MASLCFGVSHVRFCNVEHGIDWQCLVRKTQFPASFSLKPLTIKDKQESKSMFRFIQTQGKLIDKVRLTILCE